MRRIALVLTAVAVIAVAAPATSSARHTVAHRVRALESKVVNLQRDVKTLKQELAVTLLFADCGISISLNAHKLTWDLLNAEANINATYPSVQAVDDSSCDALPRRRALERRLAPASSDAGLAKLRAFRAHVLE